MRKCIALSIFIGICLLVCEKGYSQSDQDSVYNILSPMSHEKMDISSVFLIQKSNKNDSKIKKGVYDSKEKLITLLQYIPAQWIEYRSPEIFYVKFFYSNFNQIRNDMKMQNITEFNRVKYLKQFSNKFSSSNFRVLLMYDTNPEDQNYAKEWGWDILDVDQAIYLPDNRVSIFNGNFNIRTIKNKLLAKGYSEQTLVGFTVYTPKNESLIFAFKQNIMLICMEKPSLEQLIRQGMNLQNHCNNYKAVCNLLKHVANGWGAYIAAQIDLNPSVKNMEQETEKNIISKYYQNKKIFAAWDMMAISYNESANGKNVSFIYNYESNEDAEKDIPLVRYGLSKAPLIRASKWKWEDILTIKNIDVQDNLLVAATSIDATYFSIIKIFFEKDYLFLPIRSE